MNFNRKVTEKGMINTEYNSHRSPNVVRVILCVEL